MVAAAGLSAEFRYGICGAVYCSTLILSIYPLLGVPLFAHAFRWLASLKLTILLLVLLTLAMMSGTAYESAAGTLLAQLDVYYSLWFDGLLGLLAANLIACTLRRYPYRMSQLGWLLTHLGVLVVLVGAVISHEKGIEGTLKLAEGASSSTISSSSYQLEILLADGRSAVMPLHLDRLPRSNKQKPVRVNIPFNSGTIEIIQYLPKGLGQVGYVPNPNGFPLLNVALLSEKQTSNVELWSGSTQKGELMLADSSKLLYLYIPERDIDEKSLLDAPYKYLLISSPDGVSLLRVESANPTFEPVAMGIPVQLDSTSSLIVQSQQDFVIQEENFVATTDSRGEFALNFRVIEPTGTTSNSLWLVKNSKTGPEDQSLVIRLTALTHELGFTLKLNKVIEEFYPGNRIASGVSSEVVVGDPGSGGFPYHIALNHPLVYNGWKVFQYSVIPGTPKSSLFSVAYDPGTGVVYAGCIILLIGLIVAFYFTRKGAAKSTE